MNFLAVFLVIFGLVLSGCVSIPQPENKAIEIANKSTEGRALFVMRDAFSKTPQCTVEEYLQVVGIVNPMLAGLSPRVQLITDPAQAQVLVATAKECNPMVLIRPSDPANNKALVSYSISTPSACPVSDLAGKTRSVLEIESDFSTQSPRIVSGELKESDEKTLQGVLPAVGLMGNCAAPVLMQSQSVPMFS